MRRLILAAAFAALMPGIALANPCVSFVGNCNNGGNQQGQAQQEQQQQSQSSVNNNKAYGGNGGAGGQGGQGGSAAQSQSNTNTVSNDNSNQGNNQAVSFDDRLQAPAVSSFIAASGPCTGVSGGGAVSVAGFGIGASFASLEEDCKKRELLRIGFASGNAKIQGEAADGWEQMYADAFKKSGSQTAQTSQAPAAIAPEQTASLPASCIGRNTNTIWYKQNCND